MLPFRFFFFSFGVRRGTVGILLRPARVSLGIPSVFYRTSQVGPAVGALISWSARIHDSDGRIACRPGHDPKTTFISYALRR